MARAIALDLWRDLSVADDVDVSQRWVLPAMERHGGAIINLLWRILGHEQDVCDAYQDTFLQLAHNRSAGKPDHVKAYLFRTATNVAISMLRRRKSFTKVCKEYAHTVENVHHDDVGRELNIQELRKMVRTHIAELPEGLREVIILRDLAELPYAKVAQIVGISAASARVYRCRAIRLLAARMTKA